MVHELWEGDALDLASSLPDRIDCLITDPPYGVNYRSRKAATPRGLNLVHDIANDHTLDDALVLFSDVMDDIEPRLAPDSDIYIFTRWDIYSDWVDVLGCWPSIKFKMMLVWDKGDPGMGDIDCNWGCGHEIILYCKKGRREVNFRRAGILGFNRVPASRIIHPTEKPVPLIEELIRMSTNPGDLVVDPFAGSGSTVLAAQRQGRSAIGIEKDPTFAARAKARLGDMGMDFG